MKNIFVTAHLLYLLAFVPCFGAQPARFNYSAKITNASGIPLSGSHQLWFSLFRGGNANTTNSGTLFFQEDATIPISNGSVNHVVGTGSNLFGGSLTPSMFVPNGDIFLLVSVDSLENSVLPRIRLEPVPFAIHASNCDELGDGAIKLNLNGHVVLSTNLIVSGYVEVTSASRGAMEFTDDQTTATFVVPDGVRILDVEMWGAGGGGGAIGEDYLPGGGGGGAYARGFLEVSGGRTLKVGIGAGGEGGQATGSNGNDGGSTNIDDEVTGENLMSVGGGAGGAGGLSPNTTRAQGGTPLKLPGLSISRNGHLSRQSDFFAYGATPITGSVEIGSRRDPLDRDDMPRDNEGPGSGGDGTLAPDGPGHPGGRGHVIIRW